MTTAEDGADVVPGVTWSRVEDGFYVASRGGDFLGFVGRREDGVLTVVDGRGETVGRAADLAAAMSLLLDHPTPRADAAPSDTMRSVVYTSFATTRFDDDQLADLLERSRDANDRRDVTGMLLYREGRFIQVLEGPSRTVHELIDHLRTDGRHHGITVLLDEPLEERRFAYWTMGYRPWATPSDELPNGFRDAFDDLDATDGDADVRAIRALTQWFRYRADRAADDGD